MSVNEHRAPSRPNTSRDVSPPYSPRGDNLPPSDGAAWLVASVLVLAVVVAGLVDLEKAPWTGFAQSDFVTVSGVAAHSPAADAGFQVGDRMLVNNGVDTSDLAALVRIERAQIGEVQKFLVERDGEELELEMTFGALPARSKRRAYLGATVGLVFLICGLLAYLRAPTPPTRLLAGLGLAAILALTNPPYISFTEWRLLYFVVPSAAMILIPALLVHFLLRLGRPEPLSRLAVWGLYGPPIASTLLTAYTVMIAPSLFAVARGGAIVVVMALVLFAFALLIRKYVRSSRDERSLHGLHGLLFGVLAGILPVLASSFVPSMPGGRYTFLFLALIPIALMRTALKARQGSGAATFEPRLAGAS